MIIIQIAFVLFVSLPCVWVPSNMGKGNGKLGKELVPLFGSLITDRKKREFQENSFLSFPLRLCWDCKLWNGIRSGLEWSGVI